MKKCPKCKETKDLTCFSKDSRNKTDGLQYKCKRCERVYNNDYKEKNREKCLEYNKKWRENNRTKTKEYNDQYKRRNRDKIKEYRKNNKAKYNAYHAKRRAAKIQQTPSWLTKEHLDQILEFYKKAQRLSEETGIKHSVDHIIPLQGKTVRGLHVPWNLQVITLTENISKSNKVIL